MTIEHQRPASDLQEGEMMGRRELEGRDNGARLRESPKFFFPGPISNHIFPLFSFLAS